MSAEAGSDRRDATRSARVSARSGVTPHPPLVTLGCRKFRHQTVLRFFCPPHKRRALSEFDIGLLRGFRLGGASSLYNGIGPPIPRYFATLSHLASSTHSPHSMAVSTSMRVANKPSVQASRCTRACNASPSRLPPMLRRRSPAMWALPCGLSPHPASPCRLLHAGLPEPTFLYARRRRLPSAAWPLLRWLPPRCWPG